jgi:hypothetical protein
MKNRFSMINVVFILILFGCLFSSLWWSIELLNPESVSFICNYLAPRPLLNVMFDPLNNDWGYYQGRELSYFVDFLDVKFIKACVLLQLGHFRSLSYFIIVGLIIFIQQYYGNLLFRKLSKIEIFSGSCLMVSLPVFMLNTSFFRSAKPLCSLLLCFVCYLMLLLYYRDIIFKKRNNRLIIMMIISSELLMVLSDKQGVFLVAAFGMILASFMMAGFVFPKFLFCNNHSLVILSFGTAGVILFSVLYNGLICPELIHALNGYYPDFNFQRPQTVGTAYVLGGVESLFKCIGGVAGGTGVAGGVIIISFVIYVLAFPLIRLRRNFTLRRSQQLFCLLTTFILMFSAIVVMFVMMTARHPVLAILPELSCGIYIMPTMILLFFFIMLSLNCSRRRKKNSVLVVSFFIILSLINMMGISSYIDIQCKGHLRLYYSRTPHILNIINSKPGDSDFQLLLPGEIELIKRLRKK